MEINKDKSQLTAAIELRRQAENRLRSKMAELYHPRTEEETQKLVHELEVHQIELEMQNEELRRAQEELELSRDKYAELYDFAPVGYFTFDARGVIREVNLAGAQLLGIERRLLANKPFSRFIAEADGRKIFSNHLESVLQRKGMQRCEVGLTGKDGTVTHGQLQSVTVDTIGSTGGYILCSIVDGTVAKQLETEIQNAREYAENIVETVRRPLLVLNYDLKILIANPCFYGTFKVTPEETIGNFIYDLGNRQWDISKLRVLIEEILQRDTVFNSYEVVHDFPGIGRKIILLNARQIFRKNTGSHIILLAMEDITERRLAEERISEVMRQQQAILDNIPNIAWLKDREGRYVAVNDPFSRAFGLTPKDLVGKNDNDIYPPERAVRHEKDSREVMATGTRTYFEESNVDRKGKVQYVEKIETPIFNDTGVVIGVIGIAHDITSRKEMEVSLRHDSTHDNLTGLYNRAFFDEELERLAHGRMFPVSIVMADINGLKSVNDTLGHAAGDKLIRLAARIILEAFRAEDIVARIGGDEFAVLLPGTNKNVAEEAVARIMSCPESITGKVGIAFGIASAESKCQLAEALKHSDERMYLDKANQKGPLAALFSRHGVTPIPADSAVNNCTWVPALHS
jgi:diguanylate cyclase (GGDEF)-like protein/PAS domain S-box-containing protein